MFRSRSRSRSRVGSSQGPTKSGGQHHHRHLHRCQSINRSINQSNHHHLSDYCPPGLVILPYSHSDPRAQAGAVRILPVSRSLYLQTAIDKSRHVKRQAVETKRGTQDIRQTETSSSISAGCLMLAHVLAYTVLGVLLPSPPHITHTTHTQHTHHTRQHRHLVYLLCSVLHAPIVHLVPILLFFCCVVCTRRLGRRNEHLSICLYSQSRRWIETQLDSTQLNQATDAIPTPLISYDIDDGRTAGTSTSTATQPGPANPHMA